jgi:hypothetical protein
VVIAFLGALAHTVAALLAVRTYDRAVPARFFGTVLRTAIVVARISVVTLFTGVEHAITARRLQARISAIAVRRSGHAAGVNRGHTA